jgi:hypothetical protein
MGGFSSISKCNWSEYSLRWHFVEINKLKQLKMDWPHNREPKAHHT